MEACINATGMLYLGKASNADITIQIKIVGT
jgi:hypothetical protein